MGTVLTDEDAATAALTFVVVGAGYAGVEGIAEMQGFAASVLDLYPRYRARGTRWILVEARDRLMPEISDRLADFALDELRARGIHVRLGTTVEAVTDRCVTLSPGEQVPVRTLVWTAGVAPQPVTCELGLELNPGGRIVVDEYLQVRGHESIWAIGDAAAVPDPKHGGSRPCPPTAQHAMRQGRVAAHNVAATVRGRIRSFRYKTLGVFVDMGRKQAVAETLGIKWRDAPAWFLARTYHLLQLPGAARKARLLLDWTIDLAFGRYAYEVSQLAAPPVLGRPPGALIDGEPALRTASPSPRLTAPGPDWASTQPLTGLSVEIDPAQA